MTVQLVIYNELNTDAIMAAYLHWLKHEDGESPLLFSGVNQKNYKEYKNMDVRLIGAVLRGYNVVVRSPKDIDLTIIGMTFSLNKLLELGGAFKSVTHIDNNMGSYLSLIKDVEASLIYEYKHVNVLGNQLKWRLSNVYTQVSYVKSITSIEYKRLFPKGLTDLEIQLMNQRKSSNDNVNKSNPTLLRFDELSEEDRLRLDKIILEVINDKGDGNRIHPFLDLHETLHSVVGIEHLQDMLNKGEEKMSQKEPKHTSSEIYEYISRALDMSNEMINKLMEKGMPIKQAMYMTRQYLEENPPAIPTRMMEEKPFHSLDPSEVAEELATTVFEGALEDMVDAAETRYILDKLKHGNKTTGRIEADLSKVKSELNKYLVDIVAAIINKMPNLNFVVTFEHSKDVNDFISNNPAEALHGYKDVTVLGDVYPLLLIKGTISNLEYLGDNKVSMFVTTLDVPIPTKMHMTLDQMCNMELTYTEETISGLQVHDVMSLLLDFDKE